MAKTKRVQSNPSPAVSTVSFIDNPMAPDIYADEAVGFFVTGGVVKITIAASRVNHSTNPSPVSRVVIGRLVMPMQAAQGLAAGLFNFLKSQGVDPFVGQKPN